MERTHSCITKMTLDAPTFHGVDYSPALLNSGYGTNGVGKSTFCRDIPRDSCRKEFAPDYEPGTEVLLLNREFIENCARPIGGMAKVFSMTVANGKIQKKIEDAQADLDSLPPEKEAAEKSSPFVIATGITWIQHMPVPSCPSRHSCGTGTRNLSRKWEMRRSWLPGSVRLPRLIPITKLWTH